MCLCLRLCRRLLFLFPPRGTPYLSSLVAIPIIDFAAVIACIAAASVSNAARVVVVVVVVGKGGGATTATAGTGKIEFGFVAAGSAFVVSSSSLTITTRTSFVKVHSFKCCCFQYNTAPTHFCSVYV